jgi:uncharacterized DUF497 family protein
MMDWDRISGFEWDDGNARKNADKHDVGQAEAEQVFFNDPLLMVRDVAHSADEPRIHALARTDDKRLLHVTFTRRQSGTKIRVISARDTSRKERVAYDQED